MSIDGNYLPDAKQAQLRAKGLLTESEVALKRGDMILAVSALTKTERFVGFAKDILKENKQILKG